MGISLILAAAIALAAGATPAERRAAALAAIDARAAALAEALGPGCDRVLLRDHRLLRARVVERVAGAEALLEREDGVRIVVPDGAIAAVFPADSPFPAPPAGTPETRVFLRDGRAFRGVLLARTPEGVLADTPAGRRFLPDVRLLLDGPEPPLELAEPPVIPQPLGTPAPAKVTLRTSRVREGLLVARNEDAVVLELAELGRVAFLTSGLREVDAADPRVALPPATHRAPWAYDAAGARYLTAPTGFRLRAGDSVATQALAVTSVAAGLTEHLSLSVGTAWPVLYADGAGANALATLTAGADAGELVHLSGGVTGAVAQAGSVAYLFAAATVGTPDLSASVYVGPPAPAARAAGPFGDRILALSAAARLGYGFGLVTEQWVGSVDGDRGWAGALAVRWIHRRLAIELGALYAPHAELEVFPWIGFSSAITARQEVAP